MYRLFGSILTGKQSFRRPGRTASALLAGLFLTLAVGFFFRDDSIGLPVESYWAMKSEWRHCADLVLGGDSRVYRGLAPPAMTKILPGFRILNYGFSGLGYSDRYLKALEEVLDPESKKKIVVLGINPFNFLDSAVESNGFLEQTNRTSSQRLMAKYFGRLQQFCSPLDWRGAATRLVNGQSVRYYQEFRDDGWVSSYKVPENPMEALPMYRHQYGSIRGIKVSGKAVRKVLVKIEEWTRHRIEVYGLRVPSTSEMVEFEGHAFAFDVPKFVRDFQEAGGTWLSFGPGAYHSYDGSHLHRDGAWRLSADVAEAIAERRVKLASEELELGKIKPAGSESSLR